MRAVVLAGGRGGRPTPYTTVLPKPLMGDRPSLDIIVRQLAHHGFREVVVAVGHLGEPIETDPGNRPGSWGTSGSRSRVSRGPWARPGRWA